MYTDQKLLCNTVLQKHHDVRRAGVPAYNGQGQWSPVRQWEDPGFDEKDNLGFQPLTEEEAELEWQRQLAEQEESEEDDRSCTLALLLSTPPQNNCCTACMKIACCVCVPSGTGMDCHAEVLLGAVHMPIISCADKLGCWVCIDQ